MTCTANEVAHLLARERTKGRKRRGTLTLLLRQVEIRGKERKGSGRVL